MSGCNWNDVYSLEQMVEQLREIAEKQARKYGDYNTAADLKWAAQCIEELDEERTAIARKVASSVESLSKLP